MDGSWILLVVVEQTMKDSDYLNITADQLHHYMVSVFPTENGTLKQDKVTCHRAQIELE